jgi:hypothetical protein
MYRNWCETGPTTIRELDEHSESSLQRFGCSFFTFLRVGLQGFVAWDICGRIVAYCE